MGRKLQLTVTDEVFAVIAQRARERGMRVNTYAAAVLSARLLQRGFDDGF